MPRSLPGQLIASVWLGMAIVMVPFNLYSLNQDRQKAAQRVLTSLRDQGQITQYIITKWTRNITDLVQLIATSPSVRSMNADEANELFDRLHLLYPKREWRLFNSRGELVAGTDILRPVSPLEVRKSDYFQKAINGQVVSDVEEQCLSTQACFMMSAPVYAKGSLAYTTNSDRPIGVVSVIVQLKDTSDDSGMKGQLNKLSIGESLSRGFNLDPSPLSLQNGQLKGIEILMVNRDGHVVFPISTINDPISTLTPKALLASPWGPIVKLGITPSQNGRFQQVRTSGVDFFTYSQSISADWSVVVVVDKESSFKDINQDLYDEVVRQLFFLIIVSLVIFAVCQQVARPIQRAAATIREFSAGNFEARITTTRQDAIGALFRDINETGANLLQLVNERLSHAVTDQQIETAAKIQQQFISREEHSTGAVEIAADFDPAYEVGADWFDMIHIDDVTFVVVADVCDKGVPSALFMSVFRSLLRYSLTSNERAESRQELDQCLCDTITRVNDYMAENHGLSAMFATIFIAGYRYGSGELHYLSAGHEKPFIVRPNGQLDELENSGPAVGVFGGSVYQPHSIPYQQGDILFAYTDGLVDSRSESGASFGIARVKQLLSNIDPVTCSAEYLLRKTLDAVAEHRGKADQFDDMTILIMKAGRPSEPQPGHSPVQSQGQAD